MSEDKFNIVFRGTLVKGADLAQTKANIGKLFKVQGATLEKLFLGKAVTLKKNLDFDTAQKYRAAIKKAGAQVELVEVSIAMTVQPVKSISKGKAQFGVQESQLTPNKAGKENSRVVEQTESASEVKLVLGGVEEAIAKQVSTGVPNVGVAKLGDSLSDPKEVEQAVDVDVSGISIREPQGNLVDDNEREQKAEVRVETSHLHMDEVGSDLLKPSERKTQESLELDLSALSIADVGERLSEPKKDTVPAPNTSHIHIAE